MFNSLLLVLDELGQVEPREAGEIAYMLANGQGKQRASRTGGAARRQHWRLLFLSTGEVGLSQHMASVGKQVRAGQEVRLVELQADAGKGHGLFDQLNGHPDGAALSEALRAATRQFHGAVGLEFIRRAVESAELLQLMVGEAIREFVEECKTEFDDAGEFGGQAHRVCERFGLKAVAGELATEWGLTGFPKGEFHHAMKRCFGEWLTARGTAGNAEPAAIVNTLRAFLSRNEEARFTDIDARSIASLQPPSRKTIYSRAGWRKAFDGGEREYLIDVTVFQKEIFAGHDIGLVSRVLNDAGYLQSGMEGGQVRYALQRQVGVDGRRRVYVVSDKIWDDTDSASPTSGGDGDKGAGDALGDEVTG
jgi:putative DNA primase/helicase